MATPVACIDYMDGGIDNDDIVAVVNGIEARSTRPDKLQPQPPATKLVNPRD